MNDYSCYNAVFVDGLKAFLDYTTPFGIIGESGTV